MPNPFLTKKLEKQAPLKSAPNEEIQQDLSIIQDRELQMAGFEEALRQNQELQDSKYKLLGVTYKDGPEMSRLKNAEKQLLSFFSERKLSPDPNAFEEQLSEAKNLYRELIESCRAYTLSHKRPWTASGKARKQMVLQIWKIAELEDSKLQATAEVLQKRNMEDASWANVLGAMRVAHIDLSSHEIETTGGGTSDVTVIKYPNTKLFYKKEEKLLPLREDVKALIQQKPEWKSHEALITKLLSLIDNENPISMGNMALASYKDLGIFLAMISTDLTLTSEEQAELKTFMPEFSAAFKKLNTRFGIAKDAGIEPGQDLSKRNVATSRMASLLGIPGLVTDSAAVVLKTGQENSENGIVTVMAKGEQFETIRQKGLPVTSSPELIKSLINLQLLDTICGQVDRNSSNLFFTYEERDGKRILKGVTGIDSDMAFGTTAYAALEERRDGFLQLKPIEQNGTCTLPYLDQTVCAHILSLDKNMVFFVMSDLLNQKELDALWGRIEGVQNLLLKNIDRMTDDTWPDSNIIALRNQYNGTSFNKISDLLA